MGIYRRALVRCEGADPTEHPALFHVNGLKQPEPGLLFALGLVEGVVFQPLGHFHDAPNRTVNLGVSR